MTSLGACVSDDAPDSSVSSILDKLAFAELVINGQISTIRYD